MSETTRAGRHVMRFLTPSKKYEIWLQLVLYQGTVAESTADHQGSTQQRLRIDSRQIKIRGNLLGKQQSFMRGKAFRQGLVRAAGRPPAHVG